MPHETHHFDNAQAIATAPTPTLSASHLADQPAQPSSFCSVYGPVTSWRFGRSLGIDPIGTTSICSFNCVYCQLGTIQHPSDQRHVFVSTDIILRDLDTFAPWDVDVITFSGSGEPTLALNLGELIQAVKAKTQRPVVVLTNSTLMVDPQVRQELEQADMICAKLDAAHDDSLRRINRPVPGIHVTEIVAGLECFRHRYAGRLAIQTMLLSPWSDREQAKYIHHIQRIAPDEIQLNTPTRARSLIRRLDARGNERPSEEVATLSLRCVEASVLRAFAQRLESALAIPVRWVHR